MASSLAKNGVLIFLEGGWDTWAVLIPSDATQAPKLVSLRSGFSWPAGASRDPADGFTHPITPSNAADYGTNTWDLCPEFADIAAEFAAGSCTLVAGVGPLEEYGTASEFEAGTKTVFALYDSHNSMQSYGQTLQRAPGAPGWGGNGLEQLLGSTALRSFALNHGGNWPNGTILGSFSMSYRGVAVTPLPAGPTSIDGTGFGTLKNASAPASVPDAVKDIYDLKLASLSIISNFNTSMALPQIKADGSAHTLDTGYTSSQLGQSLKKIAEIIARQPSDDTDPRIYCVTQKGYDTHGNETGVLPGLLQDLNDNIKAFMADLRGMQILDNTLLFTMSDFGRTANVNGDGSDHGWGGLNMVFGGGITGGKIVGRPADPDPNDPNIYGPRMRIVPDIEISEFAAFVLGWMGLNSGQVDVVVPKLSALGASPLSL